MNILVVEDDRLNLLYLENILKRHGVVHEIACDGTRAAALLERRRYDAVLMDIQIPGIHGVHLVKHLRATPNANRETPVVVVTAHAMRGDREHFIALGATDYVSKPFGVNELMGTLCRCVLLNIQPGPLGRELEELIIPGKYEKFVDEYVKHKKKGDICMEKNTVTREEHVSAEQLAKLLEELAAGFRRGSVSMRLGMEAITLTPPNIIFLELEMSQKKRKEKLEIEITWKRLEENEKSVSSS
jgi:amphi-Trp domain-containing protein